MHHNHSATNNILYYHQTSSYHQSNSYIHHDIESYILPINCMIESVYAQLLRFITEAASEMKLQSGTPERCEGKGAYFRERALLN
jgi:hypothetical protein